MSAPELFSVPRRFDLVSILVGMTGFAILLAALRFLAAIGFLDIPAISIGAIVGLFVAVALSQVVFEDMSPRGASILAAIPYWYVVFIYWAYSELSHHHSRLYMHKVLSWTVIGPLIVGIITGYLVGALVAGVFLVSHHLRSHSTQRPSQFAADSPWDEPPLEITDFE